MKNHVDTMIFHTRDLCLRALDTNSLCAKNVRRNEVKWQILVLSVQRARGLGLAILLNNNGHNVKVWSVFTDEIEMLKKEHEHKRCLPGVKISENIEFTADIEYAVKSADVLVLAVASPYTRSTSKLLAPFVKQGQIIVNVGKGIEEDTLMTLCEVVSEEIPQCTVAVLSGPSHAEEVGRGIPTTCVIGTHKKKGCRISSEYIYERMYFVCIQVLICLEYVLAVR